MSKKVSVIIPVYNVEPYLETCIESLINQTYHDCEFIFVNDGSTDGSGCILDQYGALDARARIIHQPNCGISATRNRALKEATGEYVTFLDSDDWIDLNAIETALNYAETNDLDVVMWPYCSEYAGTSMKRCFFGVTDRIWDETKSRALVRRMIGPYREELVAPHELDACVTVWGKLYRREIIEGIQFLDLKKIGVEDAVFNIEAFSKAKRAGYVTACYTHYRKINEASFTQSYKSDLINRWHGLYNWIEAFLEGYGASEDFYEAFSNRVCLHMIGIGLNELNNPAGFFSKGQNLREVLSSEPWESAYKKLLFQYFPLKWKVFFFLCKHKQTELLLIMLYAINRLKKWLNK